MKLPLANQEAQYGDNLLSNVDHALHVDEQPPNVTNEPELMFKNDAMQILATMER
jgi:hypothetical protein